MPCQSKQTRRLIPKNNGAVYYHQRMQAYHRIASNDGTVANVLLPLSLYVNNNNNLLATFNLKQLNLLYIIAETEIFKWILIEQTKL